MPMDLFQSYHFVWNFILKEKLVNTLIEELNL